MYWHIMLLRRWWWLWLLTGCTRSRTCMDLLLLLLMVVLWFRWCNHRRQYFVCEKNKSQFYFCALIINPVAFTSGLCLGRRSIIVRDILWFSLPRLDALLLHCDRPRGLQRQNAAKTKRNKCRLKMASDTGR